MRLMLVVLLLMAGCADLEYRPYEGKNNDFEGMGGTKITLNGIDIYGRTAPRRAAI